jgi:beta-glucosidase
VHDPARLAYLQGHLRACARALAEGVPLDAYLAWSLMDNFEWGQGYLQRFGLVHVDYDSQVRTPKDSALAYRDFIASAGALRG